MYQSKNRILVTALCVKRNHNIIFIQAYCLLNSVYKIDFQTRTHVFTQLLLSSNTDLKKKTCPIASSRFVSFDVSDDYI